MPLPLVMETNDFLCVWFYVINMQIGRCYELWTEITWMYVVCSLNFIRWAEMRQNNGKKIFLSTDMSSRATRKTIPRPPVVRFTSKWLLWVGSFNDSFLSHKPEHIPARLTDYESRYLKSLSHMCVWFPAVCVTSTGAQKVAGVRQSSEMD